VLGSLALAALASSAQGPAGEGPLGNDVFLPVSEEATKELLAGDVLAAAKDGDRAANLSSAFEAWRRALAAAEDGDCVGIAGADAAPRGVESVESAVLRRLGDAGSAVSLAWSARFEPIASAALDAAHGDPEALARVERAYPRTRAAARAALALADLAQESGDPLAGAAWLGRALRSAGPKERDLREAIDRRSPKEPAALPGEPWRTAAGLALEVAIPLEGPATPHRGVVPGIAFLADGRVCVQTATALQIVGADRRARDVELLSITRSHGWRWLPPFAEKDGTWPLLPASDGRRIALVAGRALRERGNALLLLDAAPGREEPQLEWGYSDAGFVGLDGSTRPTDELLGPGLWEFEPGPRIAAGRVVAQARQWTPANDEKPSVDERTVRAWCLAFDLGSGLPRWKRLLAVGGSAKPRFGESRGWARPAQPLAIQGGAVLAGTGIGAGARIDLCDGRIAWTWKFRRAPEGARTWSLSAPLVPPSAAEAAPAVWAPPESDRLYLLGAGGERLAREIGDDVAPLAAGAERVLLLSRSSGRTALAFLAPKSGRRVESVELPRSEAIPPAALSSTSRAIVASDRAVHLFDLDRDGYLLDSVLLPDRAEDPEGAVAARGDRVFVAGESRLWILRVR
jgi:hypothetical protein